MCPNLYFDLTNSILIKNVIWSKIRRAQLLINADHKCHSQKCLMLLYLFMLLTDSYIYSRVVSTHSRKKSQRYISIILSPFFHHDVVLTFVITKKIYTQNNNNKKACVLDDLLLESKKKSPLLVRKPEQGSNKFLLKNVFSCALDMW